MPRKTHEESSDISRRGIRNNKLGVEADNNIILAENTLAQLRDICQQVTHRHRVADEWGFKSAFSRGRGIAALFTGDSGTGKTKAAQFITQELSLDLIKINLSGVVSKYIGETEKNLEHIFATAEHSNSILFLDEGDALFGKRTKVSDPTDRYAITEINYLLQKMKEYDGIVILAINQSQNIDNGFLRRIRFTVPFPSSKGQST